ncbi:integrase/recombinase xerD homolog [Mercenaria mercenaria]|uniref:integrase/recombinase xerD homolog n=1 Tax=Mercenaria mercenaria TaxID=6596 RepID=UPI00234E5B20|nr:integrase/recombinase xerD homolog [Mercenaria mercenaria]
MAQKLSGSRSDNTNIKYISYFKKWEKFISEKGGSSLPASPIHAALYITDLLEKCFSDHVISATVYSLKWAHGLKGLQDPTDNSFVKNLLENAKRNNCKPTSKKEPPSTQTLIDVCAEYSESSDILFVRDLCMILLGFAGFLRYDELSSLRCNDIVFRDDHFCLKIRKSKTGQYRLVHEIVTSKGVYVACPYNMLRRYLSLSNQTIFDSNYLFRPCFRSNSTCKLTYKSKPLSYTRARECIIGRLRPFTGDLNIGLHSLRSGGAITAANSGVNDRCWKRHGRWKSDSSKDGYVADSLSSRLVVSQKLSL